MKFDVTHGAGIIPLFANRLVVFHLALRCSRRQGNDVADLETLGDLGCDDIRVVIPGRREGEGGGGLLFLFLGH